MRAAVVTLLIAMAFSPSALACAFHGFVVQPTLVDRLLSSESVVLARPDPGDEFRYVAVEALAGDLKGVEIPLFVDSMTRRRLMKQPADGVLFAREGDDGEWRRLILMSPGHRPLIEAIIARLPAWRAGDDDDRVQLFAPYISDKDATIQGLALREIDRLSYGELKKLSLEPDVEELLSRIGIASERHLVPIRALLLGLSDDVRARAYIEQVFASRLRSGHPALGAFATALVEMQGGAAVLEIAAILSDRNVPLTSRGAIVEALSIHAEASEGSLLGAINATISLSIVASPDLAGSIARHFGSRSNWAYTKQLSDVMMRGDLASAEDFDLVSRYLASYSRRDRKLPDFLSRTPAN